jgi:hypothetical protein
MKKVVLLLGSSLLLCTILAGAALAQMGMMGWGMGSAYNRMYDPATVETVKGEVASVDTFSMMAAMKEPYPMMGRQHYGIHAMLKTDKETIPVHLGPGWFIENQDIKIAAKDTIQVTGSRITYNEKPAIIAARVIKGQHELRLRDENGVPAWCGWRMRSMGPEPIPAE